MVTLSSNYKIGINLRWGRSADLSSSNLEAVYSRVDIYVVMDTHYLVQARRAEPGPVQDPRHRWIMNTLPVTVKLVVSWAIGNGGLDWNVWKLSASGISRTSK